MSQKKTKIAAGKRFKKITGYLLIDLLMGTLLFSFAGTGLVSGSVQLLNVREKVIRHFTSANALRLLYLRLEMDLGRTVLLPDYPFRAGPGWVEWPMDKTGSEALASGKTPLSIVRYELKNESIIRIETPLPKSWSVGNEKKQVLIRGVHALDIQLAYRDPERGIFFQSEWCESDDCGLPSAVKVELKMKNSRNETASSGRLITIPHGKPGVVEQSGEG